MQRSSVEEDPPTSSKENPTERTEDDRLALARPFLIVYSLIFIVMVVFGVGLRIQLFLALNFHPQMSIHTPLSMKELCPIRT